MQMDQVSRAVPKPSGKAAASSAPRSLQVESTDDSRSPLGPWVRLRMAGQWLFCFCWSAFAVSFALLLGLFTWNRGRALTMARTLWAPPLLWAAGAKLEVEPLPDVDWTRPYIFVMNHQSMVDIACAFKVVPVNLRFIAKRSLRLVPFIGWYMWLTQMVFVDRSNRHKAVRSLERAARRIHDGASIIAYPEGTRSRDRVILPFKKGVFVLAINAQVPIIPIAIDGSHHVVPPGTFRIGPGRIRMKLGKPIETAGLSQDDREDLLVKVRDAIIALNLELGGKGGTPDAISRGR